MFLANGGETRTGNYKCSLERGCTGSPKFWHLSTFTSRDHVREQLCPDSPTPYPQICIDTVMLWETQG